MEVFYEHKPLEYPSCQSKNILKVIPQYLVSSLCENPEANKLLNNNEAVIYDGDDFYNDPPRWQCVGCCLYFYRDESPPERYIFDYKPLECPVCHSRKIADILYGEPCFDKKLQEQEIVGEVIVGGCCINDGDPAWRCYECEQDLHRKGGLIL
jgi:hypothetical protein